MTTTSSSSPSTTNSASSLVASKTLYSFLSLQGLNKVSSSLAALFASTCCPLQLALNALGYGCAGFSVVRPYRPLFLSFTFTSVAANWVQTLLEVKRSHGDLKYSTELKRLGLYTASVLTLAFSEKIVLYFASSKAPQEAQFRSHFYFSNMDTNNAKELNEMLTALEAKNKLAHFETQFWQKSKAAIVEVYTREQIPSDSLRQLILEEANATGKKGLAAEFEVMNGLNRATSNDFAFRYHFTVKNVKCGACFSSAVSIVKGMDKSLIENVEAVFEEDKNQALMVVDTFKQIPVADLEKKITDAYIADGKKFKPKGMYGKAKYANAEDL